MPSVAFIPSTDAPTHPGRFRAVELAPSGPGPGQPFLAGVYGTAARIVVEAAFGANLAADPATWPWTDITADVRQAGGQGISISPMGRSDETSQSQPAGCTFDLDNTTSAYSKGPGSKWYPYIRRNTPIRVRLTVDGKNWYVRFQGYANGFTPWWDITGNLAVVTVSASGILRRLQQGATPTHSLLRRATDATNPTAYWPWEDGSSATAAGSATGGVSMSVIGTVGFAKAPALAGSDALADVSSTTTASGTCLTTNNNNVGSGWMISFWHRATASSSPYYRTAIEWDLKNSTHSKWVMDVTDTSSLYIFASVFDFAGNSVPTTGTTVNQLDGNWHLVQLAVVQATSNTITVNQYVDGNFVNTATSGTGYTVGQISGVSLGSTVQWDGSQGTAQADIGHISVYSDPSARTSLYQPGLGYAGETVTARLTRLCGEQGVPLTITGTSTTTMGVQASDTFINLIRECETTDDGVLYDGRGPGLSYTTRTSRYNATSAVTLDMSANPPQVDEPFAPVDDDQRNRNLVKLSRKNGGSVTFEDATSSVGTATIGVYETSVTVNTQDDSTLQYRAAWEVHKGTIDGLRYPNLNLDLAAVTAVASNWLNADVSSRIDVTNVTSKAVQHPPGNLALVLEGWNETLSPFAWTVAANCSLFVPYRIAVIEGTSDTGWRIDSSGSTVAANANVGDTSISVAVADGYLWSTSAGDYPRDLNIGGVQVTVTGCSGASSPQTFTTSALPYALTAGWTVALWQPPTIAL